MTLNEALKYMRRYQDWRTGLDIRNMEEAGITPAKLTVAIDVILAEHGMDTPITNCTWCKNNIECDDGTSRCTSAACKFEHITKKKITGE